MQLHKGNLAQSVGGMVGLASMQSLRPHQPKRLQATAIKLSPERNKPRIPGRPTCNFTGAVSVAQMTMPCSQFSLCCGKFSGHAPQSNTLYAILLNLTAPCQVYQCAGELCSWHSQIGCSHSASAYHPSPTSAKRHIHPSAEQHADAQQDLIALHYTTAQMRW